MKKNNLIILFLVFGTLSITACKKNKVSKEWAIPKDEVLDGGPGKDGIPSVDDPIFITAATATYLNETDLVLGYVSGNVAKAYPHAILNWHEIINDNANGDNIAIIYCPLTGTGIGWSRELNGETTTFGVSGFLYNSNIIPYDRKTDSNWSQLRMDCVNGELSGTEAETYQLVETTWETWKEMYPSTTVVSEETGVNRNYSEYPYGDYRTNHSNLNFPVSNSDGRLPNKQRVLGVLVNDKAKAYSLTDFGDNVTVIEDLFNTIPLVAAGSSADNFIVAFDRRISGVELDFEPVQDSLPIILKDNEGNRWDVFGNALSGPRTGQKLIQLESMMGYWFSYAAFYPGLELY